MRKSIYIILALFFCLGLNARQAENEEMPDSTFINRFKVLNDYSLIGIQYGAALSSGSFQPVVSQNMVFVPINLGVTFTTYSKMFGYMPYFGLQLGAFYTEDAYEFAMNSKGYPSTFILGAYKARMRVLEIPALAQFHYDFWRMRLIVNAGPYVGYRMSIDREYFNYNGKEYPTINEEKQRAYQHAFHPNENRFDYGLKAGGGFALIFDPFEIHITASYKYSLSNLHQPDVNLLYLEHDNNSKYYYKWSYPTNIIISAGIHYQLSRRVGATRKELKQRAYDDVMKEFGYEDNSSEDRRNKGRRK